MAFRAVNVVRSVSSKTAVIGRTFNATKTTFGQKSTFSTVNVNSKSSFIASNVMPSMSMGVPPMSSGIGLATTNNGGSSGFFSNSTKNGYVLFCICTNLIQIRTPLGMGLTALINAAALYLSYLGLSFSIF